ncbi:phytanoyl-CoA dioxygenase family protein [uncultured Mucilaginibacter sp.]|uniref:phytanoyl-CoA dioxygenase family protein n=1 Tax=uncultured Mucilaginibacter sp. TaxID=797541 RepID=UPI00261EBBD4|nr:phytanoyl-CoA dioxygenase family protein [uncultured Mucilaginibacter sp.]
MIKLECPNFTLGNKLTQEQLDFFDKNGVIIFRNFITRDTVETLLTEINTLQKTWLDEGREKVNGTPLKFGKDENGQKIIQRFCFSSLHNTVLHEFLKDPRFKALPAMVAPFEGRIGEDEKDGLVINQYIKTPDSTFSQMGWHTDSPRDIFLGQRIMPMLNVGIHLDDCPAENGGLRVLTGTHKQGILKLLFAKKYFIDNNEDAQEVGFDIQAGDLTVHDGRLWHRVQQSPYTGLKSRRRVMYIPIITGKMIPKNEQSKTPFYHHFGHKAKF